MRSHKTLAKVPASFQLTDENVSESTRKETVLFLKEFCTFSRTLQPQAQESFFQTLNHFGVLPALQITLASENSTTKSASMDILLFIVDFSPPMVHEYMLSNAEQVSNATFVLTNLSCFVFLWCEAED